MLRVRYVLSADYQVAEYSCSNESSFSHLCDSLNNRIKPNCIELCLPIQITFSLKKIRVLTSQMTLTDDASHY